MKLTKKDIVNIIGAISSQCPDAFNFRKESDTQLVCEFWYESLKEYSKEIVLKAVQTALKNSDYQKRNWLGAICQEIEKMQSATEKSDLELWAELKDVLYEVRDCTYSFFCTYRDEDGLTQADRANMRIDEIYAGLDTIIKDYLRNRENLIALSRADSTELSIEKGRFLKALPQIRERNKTLNAMPQDMRLFFSELTQQTKSNNEVPKLTNKK